MGDGSHLRSLELRRAGAMTSRQMPLDSGSWPGMTDGFPKIQLFTAFSASLREAAFIAFIETVLSPGFKPSSASFASLRLKL